MLGSLIDMVRNTPNNHAKIMNFASGMASFLFTMFAPLERKGRGNFQEKVLKEVQKSGKPLIDVANEVRMLVAISLDNILICSISYSSYTITTMRFAMFQAFQTYTIGNSILKIPRCAKFYICDRWYLVISIVFYRPDARPSLYVVVSGIRTCRRAYHDLP